jgi:hypothetical protein
VSVRVFAMGRIRLFKPELEPPRAARRRRHEQIGVDEELQRRQRLAAAPHVAPSD